MYGYVKCSVILFPQYQVHEENIMIVVLFLSKIKFMKKVSCSVICFFQQFKRKRITTFIFFMNFDVGETTH